MAGLCGFFLCSLLLILHNKEAVKAFDIFSIKNDLDEFNMTCPQDSCTNDETDSLSSRSCHCGIQCAQLDTCCFDSYYVDVPQPKLKPTCRAVYSGKAYYIVGQCGSTDSVWANLCHEEWNGDDDLQKLVPVTSLSTAITYKNYYCFRCHETTDEFLYWNIQLRSQFAESKPSKKSHNRISLTYQKDKDEWMASYGEENGSFPVSLSLEIPNEISKLIHVCELDIISNCSSEWTDEEVRKKCESYMAIKQVRRENNLPLNYKNIHCALCNFVSLNDITCWKTFYVVYTVVRQKFSFTYLLDINRSDGELVGKIQKCPEDHLWDPYAEKCRKLSCALPGFKVENGKCVQ